MDVDPERGEELRDGADALVGHARFVEPDALAEAGQAERERRRDDPEEEEGWAFFWRSDLSTGRVTQGFGRGGVRTDSAGRLVTHAISVRCRDDESIHLLPGRAVGDPWGLRRGP